MLMSDFLEVAGVRIPIADGPGGVRVVMRPFSSRTPYDALEWVMNAWAAGQFPDLLEKLERGEDATARTYGVLRSAYPLEADELAGWRALAGSDPEPDPVLVATVFTPQAMAVPRAALVEILRAFKRVRNESAHLPRPEYPSPAPLAPGETLPPKQLFTRTPSEDQPPTEYERVSMAEIDDLASALDVAHAAARTPDQRADVTVKRRVLLEELEAHGLLDEARQHEKRAWLESWRMPTLRDYVDAAIALRRYYASEARSTYTLPAPPARLLDGAVSLDWFRRPGPVPEASTPDTWLAFCEVVLHENPPGGASGEVLSKVGGRWYQIHWRREAGDRPAVVAAAELVR
jgi:hypothetical protein